MDQLFREHDGEYIDLTTGQMQFIIDILVKTGYIRCSKNADDPQKSKFSYILWLHHKLWFIRVMLPFCLIQLQSLVHEPFKSVTGVVQKQTTCWYRDCLIKYHWEFYCVSNQVVYFYISRIIPLREILKTQCTKTMDISSWSGRLQYAS